MGVLTVSQIAIRLLVSLIIGIIIGLEREIQHKSAGLRTSVLICVGATIFTIASLEFNVIAGLADPSRIAAQIVTGIGFLGAGAIIQTRHTVHGLTTAATIWVMASLGLAVGLGSYPLAIGGAILAVIVLNPFHWIEHAVKGKKTSYTYTLILSDTGPALEKIMKALHSSPTEIRQVTVTKKDDQHVISFNYTDLDDKHAVLLEKLTGTEGVMQISTDEPQG